MKEYKKIIEKLNVNYSKELEIKKSLFEQNYLLNNGLRELLLLIEEDFEEYYQIGKSSKDPDIQIHLEALLGKGIKGTYIESLILHDTTEIIDYVVHAFNLTGETNDEKYSIIVTQIPEKSEIDMLKGYAFSNEIQSFYSVFNGIGVFEDCISLWGSNRIFPVNELYPFNEISDSFKYNPEVSPNQFIVMMINDEGDCYAYNNKDKYIYVIENQGHYIDSDSKMSFEDFLALSLNFH